MAKKKTRKKSNVQLGRWKESQRKRGRFFRKALSQTEATIIDIAGRIGPRYQSTVSNINRKDKIRPSELTKAIAGRALSKALSSRKQGWRKDTNRKKNNYSKNRRKQIVDENQDVINLRGNEWWRSELVKRAFGRNRNNFFRELELFVLKELSYFDPKKKDKKGQAVKVRNWIWGGINLFCRRKHFEEKRRLEKEIKLSAELIKDGTPVVARSWIPWETKCFLRKIELDPEKVADLGFDEMRKQILEIAKAEETGLTPKEQKIVRLRLEGKTFIEIAKKFGLRSKSTIHANEKKIAEKLRERLKKL